MSKARCCYSIVVAVLLVTGFFVFGAYFFGKYTIRDLSQSFFDFKSFTGIGFVDSVSYGKIRIRDFSMSSIVYGGNGKSAFSPTVNVSVEDFNATFDNKMRFNIASILLSYDLLRGKEVKISIPHKNIRIIALQNNNKNQDSDDLECNIGAELVLGFRDNIFLHSLKKKWSKSKRNNQIVYAHYRDGAGASCKSLGKKAAPIYDNANFEFHALGEHGIKLLADITAKKADNSGFLSLGIKDLEVFLLSGNKSGFDVNIPQFRLWSDNFSSSISGVAFVSGGDIWGLLNNCKLDLLVETRGYENFFEFVGSSWSAVVGQQNEGKFNRGMDALKRAVRSVSSFEKESDSVTLEIKSDEGEQIKIGNKSLGEFMYVVRELYEEKIDKSIVD